MIVGDLIIAQVLQEELDSLKSDTRQQADLFASSPIEVQEAARRFFVNPKTEIEIVQGFTADPPKVPQIAIVLAGEEEYITPIGGAIDEAYSQDTEIYALGLQYTSNPDHQAFVTIDVPGGTLKTLIINTQALGSPEVTADQLVISLASAGTIADLATTINNTGKYLATASSNYALRNATDLTRQRLSINEADVWLKINPLEFDQQNGTMFRATWKISALSLNPNVTLWVHAFIKWALLKRRIDLELMGLHSAQLSGGDFEPAPEWIQKSPDPIYTRGALLTAIYVATWIDRYDVPTIKYTDVRETFPRSYTKFS